MIDDHSRETVLVVTKQEKRVGERCSETVVRTDIPQSSLDVVEGVRWSKIPKFNTIM
jgi:hypothetical protein